MINVAAVQFSEWNAQTTDGKLSPQIQFRI